ncbi:hypothetical protein E2C01_073740 [Portunus trituberculatus]|uniref:Uncharacterized protein n=1 Tax=Portunus trituberculatus TaxID=210409 RepID=A0A5B7IEN7_PORTR|nr:hypothetical protein [Portunus trituberculatus]
MNTTPQTHTNIYKPFPQQNKHTYTRLTFGRREKNNKTQLTIPFLHDSLDPTCAFTPSHSQLPSPPPPLPPAGLPLHPLPLPRSLLLQRHFKTEGKGDRCFQERRKFSGCLGWWVARSRHGGERLPMFQGRDVPDGIHLRVSGGVFNLPERGPAATPRKRRGGSRCGCHVRADHDAGAIRGSLHDWSAHGALPWRGWHCNSLQMVRQRERQAD